MARRNNGINIPVELQTQDAIKDLTKLTKAVVQAQRIIISSNKRLNQGLKETNENLRQMGRNANGSHQAIKKYGQAIDKASRELNELDRVQNRVAKSGKKLSGGLGEVSTLFRNMLSGGLLIGIGKGFLSATTQVENLETQFKTLLGSTDKAKERIAELSDFASKTPFQLEEVAQASRILETLTKGALSTGEGLRLVGDASATTGANFKELSMWVGRAYDGLQSNRPIGEATMRLQELGLVSGDTRSKIEALQKQGQGKKAWQVLRAELEKNNGGMEDLSKTTTGLWSTTKDLTGAFFRSVDGIMASGGALKKLLITANKYLDVAVETYEALAKTEAIRERNRLLGVQVNLTKVARARAQELLGMRELEGKLLVKIGKTLDNARKIAEEGGKDELWVQERLLKSQIRYIETFKLANKESESWSNFAQEKIDLLKLELAGIEKVKKAQEKPAKVGKGKDPIAIVPEDPNEAKRRKKLFDDLLSDMDKVREKGEDVGRSLRANLNPRVQVVDSEVERIFRELEGNGYDPDALSDKASRGFDELFNVSADFRQKFFKQRTDFFNKEAEARAEANRQEIEEIKKQAELKRELEAVLKAEETGYLLEDIKHRGALEYELLEQDYKRKLALAKGNAEAQYILEKNFQQKKQNLINDTFNAQVRATTRASQIVLNDMQTIFGETKALAIAEATIKGFQSAVNSFEYGTSLGGLPLGYAMASLSLGATGMYIGKISSQNFATGGFPTGANANVTMNERGQESILNASATARLGRENINRLNSGQSIDGTGNTQPAPSVIQVTYSPSVSFTGAEPPDLFNTLENDLERVGELLQDAVRRGYASV